MVRQIGPRELARWLANDHPVYLLDVRQPWEHEAAALPGSVLIPLDQLAARRSEISPPEGVPVVAYCHHGVRSQRAAALLQQMGIVDVLSLSGGIDAWSCEVDPTVPRY